MIDHRREVYVREYPRLLRALDVIGRDPAAAEDAAQEAFVKARRTRLENIEKLPAWLLVVGVREVFRKARRSKRARDVWASFPARNDLFDAASDGADLLTALGDRENPAHRDLGGRLLPAADRRREHAVHELR